MPMKNFFLFSVLPIFLLGCSSFDDESDLLPQQEAKRTLQVSSAEEVSLAPDPNSLDIMRRAVDSVARNTLTRSRAAVVFGAQIEPTHRYVCFRPATDMQWSALCEEDGFIVSGVFPLDELSPVSEADNCYLPVEGDSFDKFYAVMPVTIELPDTIVWEVLKEFYDPCSSEEGRADPAWAERVTAQARALVDDERHPGDDYVLWKPSGQLRVWDDLMNRYVPLEGVDVTLTDPSNLLAPIKLKTDANGRYSYSKTIVGQRNHSYSLSNTYWTIFHQAYRHTGLPGPALSKAWNVDIAKSSTVPWQMAMVYRAVYRYWYKSGLSKPDFRGLTNPNLVERRLRVNCSDKNSLSTDNVYKPTAEGYFLPKDGTVNIACRAVIPGRLFAVVVHELGHAARFVHADESSSFIEESWASFVQWYLTVQEYGAFIYTTYTVPGTTQTYIKPDELNRQKWIPSSVSSVSLVYTPLFIDLYDDFDQHYWYSVIEPNFYAAADLLKIPEDKISLRAGVVEQIAFRSGNMEELVANIRSVASQNGISAGIVEDFLQVYYYSGMIKDKVEDNERH